MALRMHFENCVSFRVPFLGLLVSMGIDVKLGQEGLDITLILDGQNTSIEVLSEDQLLFFCCLHRLVAY